MNTIDKIKRVPIEFVADRIDRLEEFVLWLTPCGDPSISKDKHPTYELIGDKARELLVTYEVPFDCPPTPEEEDLYQAMNDLRPD